MSISFQLVGIDHEPFQSLFDLSDVQLAARCAKKCIADESPIYPCRTSLEDAQLRPANGSIAMSLNFRTIAIAASVICFVLSGTSLLAPSLLLEMWGVQYSYAVGLIARRAAALFLGFGVMFVLARDARPSDTRTALTVGLSVACLALAALGVFEFATGHAGG